MAWVDDQDTIGIVIFPLAYRSSKVCKTHSKESDFTTRFFGCFRYFQRVELNDEAYLTAVLEYLAAEGLASGLIFSYRIIWNTRKGIEENTNINAQCSCMFSK